MRFELLKFKIDFYGFSVLNNFSLKRKRCKKRKVPAPFSTIIYIYNRTNRIAIIKQFETLIKKKARQSVLFLSVKRQLNFNSIL